MTTSLTKAAGKGKEGKGAGGRKPFQQQTLEELFLIEQQVAEKEKQRKKKEEQAKKKKEVEEVKKTARAKLMEDKKKAEERKAAKLAAKKKEEESRKEEEAKKADESGVEATDMEDAMETETPTQDWKREREPKAVDKAKGDIKTADLTKTPTTKKNRPNSSTPKNDLKPNGAAPMEGTEETPSPDSESEATEEDGKKNGGDYDVSEEESSEEEEELDVEGLKEHTRQSQRAVRNQELKQAAKDKAAKQKVKAERAKARAGKAGLKQSGGDRKPKEEPKLSKEVDLITPEKFTPPQPTQEGEDGSTAITLPCKGSASKPPPKSYGDVARQGAKLPSIISKLSSKNDNGTHQEERKNIIYGKFKVTIQGAQMAKKLRAEILKIAKAGLEVDPKFCFYGYDNRIATAAMPKISSDKDNPTTSQKLKPYFNGLSIKPDDRKKKKLEIDRWISARVGFSDEESVFMEDFKANLYENNIRFYELALNFPWVKEAHMIFRSHPNMNVVEHQNMLDEAMKTVSREEGRGDKTVPFALKLRTIEDGKDKAALQDVDWRDLQKAVYVSFPQHKTKEGSRLMSYALKHEAYRKYNRFMPSLIPKWTKRDKDVNKLKILKQLARHKAMVGETTKVILEEVVDIDMHSEELGITGREAIMNLNRPDSLVEKALLVADTRTYGSGGMVVTFPMEWTEVMAYVPFMPAILMRTYGEAAAIWLTPEGVTIAEETQWNDETNMPVSEDEQLLLDAEEETPTWSKAQLTNLDMLEKDKEAARPARGQEWQHSTDGKSVGWGYEDYTIASNSTVGNQNEGNQNEDLTMTGGSSAYHKDYHPPDGDVHTEITMDSTLKSSKPDDRDDFFAYFQCLPVDQHTSFFEQMKRMQDEGPPTEAPPAAEGN